MTEDPVNSFTNISPEILEEFKARRAQRQAGIAGLREQVAMTFIIRDSVLASYPTPEGRIDPNSDIITFGEFQNSKGDTLYTRRGSKETYPSQDEMAALSARVKSEEANFKALSPAEQARIRREGSSQFEAYLAQETLKEQFQKLK